MNHVLKVILISTLVISIFACQRINMQYGGAAKSDKAPPNNLQFEVNQPVTTK